LDPDSGIVPAIKQALEHIDALLSQRLAMLQTLLSPVSLDLLEML
jgi:hypothetical protein